jgi:hypothetical protein
LNSPLLVGRIMVDGSEFWWLGFRTQQVVNGDQHPAPTPPKPFSSGCGGPNGDKLLRKEFWLWLTIHG